MAWGARNDHGAWRLCERKGPTIGYLDRKIWPGVQIRFSSQAKAKACADKLNELYWKAYAKEREKPGQWPEYQWSMIAVIREFGGLSDEDYQKVTK